MYQRRDTVYSVQIMVGNVMRHTSNFRIFSDYNVIISIIMSNFRKRIVNALIGVMMRIGTLTNNEFGRAKLLYEMCEYPHFHSVSYLRDSYAFTAWQSEYHLRKALKHLVSENLVIQGFKGYNRYGYAKYKASEAAYEIIPELRIILEIGS